jgi:hypothetical protein
MAMASSRLLFFLSTILILTVQVIAQKRLILESCFDGNYTNNSTYETNLNQLLSSLSSNTEIDGFYKSSYGQSPDEVYATVLCRGDLKPDVCRSCVKNATELITQICPNQKEAIGISDLCMLRYSNRSSILNTMEIDPQNVQPNQTTVPSIYLNGFNDALRTLFRNYKVQLQQVILFVSMQQEMKPHQTLRQYMHLSSAHRICLSKIAMIALIAPLIVLHIVVMRRKVGE